MTRVLCALVICMATGCSKQVAAGSAQQTRGAKLLVLTTIAPMYCFTKNVAGDLAEVEMIVPAGEPASGFQPSAQQVARILQADVVVENGFGFEPWMDELEARGLKPGALRIVADKGTGPGIPGLEGDPDSEPGGAPADPTAPPEPHVWLDPIKAIKEVENIRDGLAKADPEHANDYWANENHYEGTLRDLDDQIGQMTVDIPKRRLLCWDGAFGYFLGRYEFTVAGVLNGDAKAGGMQKADAILAPPGVAVDKLNGIGLPVVIADPMESGSASSDYYEKATLANVAALREG